MENTILNEGHHKRLDAAKTVYHECKHKDSQLLTPKEHYQKHLGEMTHVLDSYKADRSHLLDFERDIDIAKVMMKEGRHPGEIPKAIRENSINTVSMQLKNQHQYGKLVTRNAMAELAKDGQRIRPERSKFHIEAGRQRIMAERLQVQNFDKGR